MKHMREEFFYRRSKLSVAVLPLRTVFEKICETRLRLSCGSVALTTACCNRINLITVEGKIFCPTAATRFQRGFCMIAKHIRAAEESMVRDGTVVASE